MDTDLPMYESFLVPTPAVVKFTTWSGANVRLLAQDIVRWGDRTPREGGPREVFIEASHGNSAQTETYVIRGTLEELDALIESAFKN